jgi:predicted TIM-barrel fold metal-dependent hydrolase
VPRAIDFHVHPALPEVSAMLAGTPEEMRAFFRSDVLVESLEATAARYKALGVMGVLLGTDVQTTTGLAPLPNDLVADAVRRWPDVFVGFAGVDPWKGHEAIEEAERCMRELGLRGLKLHPGRQAFFPDDRRFYPLWEKAAELGAIALFHTGMMAAGAGTPGGKGLKLEYTRPLPHLDNLAADFPTLQIVSAHPGWPWMDEQLALARHKANVWLDLSGWSPKYFPPQLTQMANTLLQDRVLFGSDYPFITPERWLSDFEAAPYRDEVRPKILYRNAARLLGLDEGEGRTKTLSD